MKSLFQILYLILLIAIKGVVLCQLWSWFVYPFFEVPKLSWALSAGLVTIAAVVQYIPTWQFKDYNEEFKYNVTIGLKPLVLLAVGWIIQLFL